MWTTVDLIMNSSLTLKVIFMHVCIRVQVCRYIGTWRPEKNPQVSCSGRLRPPPQTRCLIKIDWLASTMLSIFCDFWGSNLGCHACEVSTLTDWSFTQVLPGICLFSTKATTIEAVFTLRWHLQWHAVHRDKKVVRRRKKEGRKTRWFRSISNKLSGFLQGCRECKLSIWSQSTYLSPSCFLKAVKNSFYVV